MRFAVLGRDESRGALSLMRSREGWRVARTIKRHGRPLLSTAALARWVARQGLAEPKNPFWMDLRTATQELALASPGLRMPNQEALEWLFEYADEARREGSSDALRLMTAHGAKGLEFPHVIVMDCGDWNAAGDDERRLLYVAMTRAQETLTLFRAAGVGNPFLQDLEAADGAAEVVPRGSPSFRPELQRRYVTLGPKDVDIGYAGRFPASHSIHRLIGTLSVGSDIKVEDRAIKTVDGMTVGKLARSAEVTKGCLLGTVAGIMARTRAQTAAAYADGLQTDDWEVVLVELVDASN
jgi:ATP-dependent DNA helicase RecQ